MDWEAQDSSIDRYQGGGGMINYRLRTSGGTIYYRHRFYMDDLAPGFDQDDPSTYTLIVPLTTEPTTLNSSFYAQDSWRVLSNLTINAGIRWERQQIRDRFDDTIIDLTSNWAPRIGVHLGCDEERQEQDLRELRPVLREHPDGHQHPRVRGRAIVLLLQLRPGTVQLHAGSGSTRAHGCARRRDASRPGPRGPVHRRVAGRRGVRDPSEPDHRREVRTTATLGRVVEDFLVPSEGHYFIANPGEGLGREMSFYDYTPVAAPDVRREHTSIELSARKRFSEGWQFIASYVLAKLEGNYDGTFQVSTGQLDPNINSAFDYADFLVNAEGKLSNDRQHQFKFDGSYEFQRGMLNGLNLGLSTHWFSGLPLNAYGYSIPVRELGVLPGAARIARSGSVGLGG